MIKNIFKRIIEYKWHFFIIMVFVGVAFYYGYSKSKISTQTTLQPVIEKISKKNITVSVTGSGQVYAKSQVDLKPQVAGDGLDVLNVAVKNEQAVKKGDLIAILDYSDAQKSVRNAQLNLDSVNLKYDQVKDDYEDDKATKNDKEMQKISVEQSENSLADAKEKLSDYYIRTPFDGIVTGLSVEAGSSISRSDVLASVITNDMYAKISLNEVDAVSVNLGDSVRLTFDAIDDLEIEGEISKIDTIGSVEQGVVYYEAEVSFKNSDERLKPSMSVSAEIITDFKEGVLAVQSSAVKSGDYGQYVQVVDESKTGVDVSDQNIYYIEKEIKTGITDGLNIEIISGLSEGEKIIVKLPTSLPSSSENESSGGLLNSVRIPGTGGGMGR